MNEAEPASLSSSLTNAAHDHDLTTAKIAERFHRVPHDPIARWPAIAAALCVGGLSYALPENLQVGPRWLLIVIVGILLVPATLTFQIGHHKANQAIGYLVSGVLTLDLCLSLGRLIEILPTKNEEPERMLLSAAALWTTNVLVFALWYWRLDAGGPHERDKSDTHNVCDGAILFPQMAVDELKSHWKPHFVDYLFVAFNTSTAFSPTDAAVLARWAKCLMMLQSLVSLLILALLAARAINTL